MVEFLSWLWAQAGKVFYWFGDNFYYLLNFIFSLPGLIVATANNLIQSALANVQGLLNYLYTLVIAAYQLASSVVSGIVDYVNRKIQETLVFIQGLKQSILDVVTGWIAVVRTGINQFVLIVRDGLLAIIQGISGELRNWVTFSFGWIINLRDRILSLLSLLTPQRINAIINFVTTWLQTVIAFFTNPLIFILDIIQPKIISFVCYVIAWGLGTTKYELPKSQSWKD